MNDLILDNNLDLAIQNGDFLIDDCEQQNQELILIATQGSFRESPLTGVGIAKYIKSSFSVSKIDQLRQKIRLQLQYDGYQTVNTQINSFTDIQIQAER
ncbi:hypothetical protein [Mucilaginibacter lappiensis]|uniref:Uncharacterized protein n=1 Tax=Mucilaginibacter lappiensis TaxID=354630 RepID=A0A841JU16_9SPHI|nr:hypothetical protein [Mucilaginibacter lappiensis]MBB6131321.1 hypothetical protein [Mucilaginibacter lappiensis]